MKKIVFIIMSTIIIASCNNNGSSTLFNYKDNKDFIVFKEPGDIIETNSFEVFQVLDKGYALAKGLSNAKYGWYNGPIFLLKDNNHYFTDEEIFKAPKGKVFRQVGIYSYTTRGGKVFGTDIPSESKTVAVIELHDK